MKKMIRLVSALVMTLALFTTTSCEKKKEDIPAIPTEQQLLTAKTWQVEEVTFVHSNIPGVYSGVVYKRGAANNTEDFSLVRMTFKTDGSISYVDPEGNNRNDGRYELLANHNMRITLNGDTDIVENVTIQQNIVSYRIPDEDGYALVTYSPAQ